MRLHTDLLLLRGSDKPDLLELFSKTPTASYSLSTRPPYSSSPLDGDDEGYSTCGRTRRWWPSTSY